MELGGGRIEKVTTLEEINEASAQGWSGGA